MITLSLYIITLRKTSVQVQVQLEYDTATTASYSHFKVGVAAPVNTQMSLLKLE